MAAEPSGAARGVRSPGARGEVGTATVHVVVEGYARLPQRGPAQATSTCTLVTAATGKRVLVDPGSNRALLLAGLVRLGVTPESIDFVFLTHHHVDHALNAALFPNAAVVDREAIYEQDRITALTGTSFTIPGTDLEVLPTPGHETVHGSLVVPTAAGIVVVAGDVFWGIDDQPAALDPDAPDPFARDPAQLRRSREVVLRRADWVVPGHGAMLPIPKRR